MVARPLGFTTAFSVAREADTEVAAAVRAVGLLPEMENDLLTSAAARNMPLTAREALTVHVPGETYVTVLPETVHTEVVVEENATAAPEDDVAETVRDTELMATSESEPNVTVWGRNALATVASATVTLAVDPLPSFPLELLPQHHRVDVDIAHVASLPVVTACAPVTPATVSGPWLAELPPVPLPIWP